MSSGVKILIGYDVELCGVAEVEGQHITTALFLERAQALHEELGVPATMFCVGKTLEENLPQFKKIARSEPIDLQQHTYSHVLLKTVCTTAPGQENLVPAAPLEKIDEEIRKTNRILEDELGIVCRGLTGPWGYYRGLQDRPDLLSILHRNGIRFLRTEARDERDWQPLAWERQPYWYELQGYPDTLEFPIQGWQDCIYREEIGWENHRGYRDYIDNALDTITDLGVDWNVCQHDWSSLRGDPEMTLTRHLLESALARNIEITTYAKEYDRRIAERESESV